MKSLLIPSFLLAFALATSAHAQVQAQLGDVEDSRTTGQFNGRLEIQIKLLGDSLADAKYMRATVTAATDDTGRDLLDTEKEKPKFEKVNEGRSASELRLELKNPARKAASVKELTGEADLFIPKNDPDATLKVGNFQKAGGQPIVSPALTAAGIEITAYTKAQADAAQKKEEEEAKAKAKENPGEALQQAFGQMFQMGGNSPNNITVKIKDPNQKLVEIEFQDAGGNKIKSNGWSSFGDNVKGLTKTYDFNSKLPDDATLVIYLATPKSMVTVPFSLKDIFLP